MLWLDGRATLHVLDLVTGYRNSEFLNGQTVEDVRNNICIVLGYRLTRLPYFNGRRTSQKFVSTRWERRATAAGIILRTSWVESHNSLALGKRYHAPLRQLFNKVRHAEPSIAPDMALRIAHKYLNETMGPNMLVPTLLVYGMLPRMPAATSDLPDQHDRMRALEVFHREMETIVAQLRVNQELRSRTPSAENLTMSPGNKACVFRETDKKTHGPYTVVKVEG